MEVIVLLQASERTEQAIYCELSIWVNKPTRPDATRHTMKRSHRYADYSCTYGSVKVDFSYGWQYTKTEQQRRLRKAQTLQWTSIIEVNTLQSDRAMNTFVLQWALGEIVNRSKKGLAVHHNTILKKQKQKRKHPIRKNHKWKKSLVTCIITILRKNGGRKNSCTYQKATSSVWAHSSGTH